MLIQWCLGLNFFLRFLLSLENEDLSDTPGEAGGLMSVTAPRAGVLAGGDSVSR
jgi:hypothetical protein